jgi:hypothetical protein
LDAHALAWETAKPSHSLYSVCVCVGGVATRTCGHWQSSRLWPSSSSGAWLAGLAPKPMIMGGPRP